MLLAIFVPAITEPCVWNKLERIALAFVPLVVLGYETNPQNLLCFAYCLDYLLFVRTEAR